MRGLDGRLTANLWPTRPRDGLQQWKASVNLVIIA